MTSSKLKYTSIACLLICFLLWWWIVWALQNSVSYFSLMKTGTCIPSAAPQSIVHMWFLERYSLRWFSTTWSEPHHVLVLCSFLRFYQTPLDQQGLVEDRLVRLKFKWRHNVSNVSSKSLFQHSWSATLIGN